MSELKSNQVKMSIRRDTYDRLSALSKKNDVTLSALIEDMMVHIQPDTVSTVEQRLIRMESYLKDISRSLQSDHDLLVSMDQANVALFGLKYHSEVNKNLHDIESTRNRVDSLENNSPEYIKWLEAVRAGKGPMSHKNTKSQITSKKNFEPLRDENGAIRHKNPKKNISSSQDNE